MCQAVGCAGGVLYQMGGQVIGSNGMRIMYCSPLSAAHAYLKEDQREHTPPEAARSAHLALTTWERGTVETAEESAGGATVSGGNLCWWGERREAMY